MSPRLFHRLRRCRVLFALALCAWLALGSAAWAKPDCCASMGMQGMTGMHADGHATHPHGHQAGSDTCTCAHLSIDQLGAPVSAVPSFTPARVAWRTPAMAAPQPACAPPLRPPAV